MAKPETIKRNRAVYLKLPGGRIVVGGAWPFVALAITLAIIVGLFYLVIAKTTPAVWLSGGVWILFIVYWSAAARNAAPAITSESVTSRKVHQLLMYGALLLAFLPIPGLRQRWLLPRPWVTGPIGLTIQVASALLAFWARRHLGRNWSGAITAKVDHELVKSGPYKLVRHPIYTSMLGMFLGTAIVSGEIHAALAMLIIAIAYWRKIRLEEVLLRSHFGPKYDEYRKQSWALIPWVL